MNPFRFHQHHEWLFGLLLLSGAVLVAFAVHWLVFRIYQRRGIGGAVVPHRAPVLRHLRHPGRWVFVTTAAMLVLPVLPLPRGIDRTLRYTLEILLIAALTWLAIGLISVIEEVLLRRYDVAQEDNLRARRLRTQTQVLRRLVVGFIVVVGAGAALYASNSNLWKAGAGLLASAGVASLVLATAAKSTASNVLAGMQIAFSEPIRIDDVVVVEGEWGRVEEITSAYVVLRIWDLRRLIVPLTYFIEKPFQNWTRETSNLLGTAFLYVDYSVPMEPVRTELKRLLDVSPLWDGKTQALQVTNTTDRSVELRCLVSARNASELFDLRCYVRENMIKFIADNFPDSLPLQRSRAWDFVQDMSSATDAPATHEAR